MLSVWVPILLQALVPVALLGALALARPPTHLAWALSVSIVVLYVAVVALAGLWLVLPWYLPLVYAALIPPASVLSRTRIRGARAWPATLHGRVGLLARVAVLAALALITAQALAGRRVPAEPVTLAWPFDGGSYLVVNGGANQLINAHVHTLSGDRFRRYRGQSHGIDIVALDRWGLRARGIVPRDPAAYAIFGTPVRAPCDGTIIAAVDGLEDLSPPARDREHLAGNHVLLDCGAVWVLLGHLQHGSVAVRPGGHVRAGEPIGRVGNTGNTEEPHLHIHAQRPGPSAAPLAGEPVPISFGGRYPVRNARIHAQAGLP